MSEYTKEDMYEKRRQSLQKIAITIYLVLFAAQIIMFFVMKSVGLIYESTSEFVLRYMVRPMGINTIIMFVCLWIIRKSKNIWVKNFLNIMMTTLMLICMAYVHHVYSVLLVTFCASIFLTVALQDKKILNIDTVICEIATVLISLDCFLTKSGASSDTYFIPTVVIIMIILFACRYIAAGCIDILNEQQKALIEARNEALEAKQIADEANQSKSLFLSNMSHEIRTPLNAVLNYDTLILRESKEEQIKSYAVDIHNSGQTLLSLINDILDLSKIESGKMEIVEGEYEFATLIHDVVSMVSLKAESKNLKLDLKLDEKLPTMLYGDDIRIRQILVNILNNAVKYTEKGSVTLEISGEKQNSDILLRFSVKDTGIGIRAEDMGKLFEKFTRIDVRKNKYIEGTGLGMSITTAFLELMGSELKVESVYGEGSEFYFYLRQRMISEEEIGNLEARIRNRVVVEDTGVTFTAQNAHVLVVDDNSINRKVFKGLLKGSMLQIDEASGGMQCINLCKEKKYDLIFLDHMMPEMDGIETLAAMREIEDFVNAETPVIALTANAISGAKEEYLNAGFSDYLSKPIVPAKLEAMIQQYIKQ